MNYKESMEFINSYTKSGKPIENLDRIKGLMKKLGDVQSSLSFVHIAGTNGKGSITEMISCTLIDAGYKTGQFTSPYIVEFEDRIRINGANIPKERVAFYADIVKNAAIGDSYSQFEIIFAIAMLYFADEKVDVVCLEAGLGGLLDATNVIECPKAAVIASISLDHTDILGGTVEDIALQKAGIIKNQGFAVVSSQNGFNVIDTIKSYAQGVGADVVVPENFKRLSDRQLIYKGVVYELSMMGDYQFYNASCAIEALLHLSQYYNISSDNIKCGIKNAKVRARFEKLHSNPDIYFDGAHNPDATLNLKKMLSEDADTKIAVVGMIGSKDAQSAIANVAACFKAVICVDSFHPNAINRNELARIFQKNGVRAYTSTIENSLQNAVILCENQAPIVVFGSLYLYSDIYALIKTQFFCD